MKRALIVAAHPDDDILGCGGLMARFSTETKFRVVFLAEGTSCRYPQEEINQPEVQAEIERRNAFGIRALQRLGVDEFAFHNHPCGRLDSVPIIDLGKIIEQEVARFKPDTIFTHSEKDTNVDHRTAFQATLQATRPGALNLVSRLYSYEVQSSSEWRFSDVFQPNFFVALTETQLQQKIKAMMDYESETKDFPFPRSAEGLRINAQYRGMQCHQSFAEAFTLVREFYE